MKKIIGLVIIMLYIISGCKKEQTFIDYRDKYTGKYNVKIIFQTSTISTGGSMYIHTSDTSFDFINIVKNNDSAQNVDVQFPMGYIIRGYNIRQRYFNSTLNNSTVSIAEKNDSIYSCKTSVSYFMFGNTKNDSIYVAYFYESPGYSETLIINGFKNN